MLNRIEWQAIVACARQTMAQNNTLPEWEQFGGLIDAIYHHLGENGTRGEYVPNPHDTPRAWIAFMEWVDKDGDPEEVGVF